MVQCVAAEIGGQFVYQSDKYRRLAMRRSAAMPGGATRY
jgi:hypothetical protein